MGRPSLPDSPAGASLQLRRCQSADLPGSRRSRHALLWRRPPGTFSNPWGVTVLCCRQGDKITLLQQKKERTENLRSRRSRWRELCLGLYQGFELDFAVDDFHDVFHFPAIFLSL